MRADREYLALTIEQALRGGKVALQADELALRLARHPNVIQHALKKLHAQGRVMRTGAGTRAEPYRWQLCTLIDAWVTDPPLNSSIRG